MNNLPLYISITAAGIAIVMAAPLIWNKIIDKSIILGHNNLSQIYSLRKLLLEEREMYIAEIQICELFEATALTQTVMNKSETIKKLTECDESLARLDTEEVKNNYWIEVLEEQIRTR